jgi:hypothetical protein
VKLAIPQTLETATAIRKPEIRDRIKEILEDKTLALEINLANLTMATAAKQLSAAKGCLDSLANSTAGFVTFTGFTCQ